MPIIKNLYRYPIKGLTPQCLDSAVLRPGKGYPGDRAYAIAHGVTDFDPQAPRHLGKINFLTLMTHPKLAELRIEFREDGSRATLYSQNRPGLEVQLTTEEGIAAFERYLNDFIGDEAKGGLRLVTAPDHMFSDVPEDCLSVVNLASVEALGEYLGMTLDPLRFRANIYLDGLPPWRERDFQKGDMLRLGACRVRVMRPISRCAATNVNLDTAQRDSDIPITLRRAFEKNLMGVYVEVIDGGTIFPGDSTSYIDKVGK